MLKWVSLALLILLALLQFHLWMGEGGIFELRTIGARVEALHGADQKLKDRNDQLAAEVVDLKTGLDAVEERARNDLGMVRNDEQFLWVPDVSSKHPDNRNGHLPGATNAPDGKPAPSSNDGDSLDALNNSVSSSNSQGQ